MANAEEDTLKNWAEIEEVAGMSRRTILKRIKDGDQLLGRAIRPKRKGTKRIHVHAFKSELVAAIQNQAGIGAPTS